MRNCPFCGSDHLEVIEVCNGDLQCVTCWDCGAYGPDEVTDKEAIESWNGKKLTIQHDNKQQTLLFDF